MIEPPFDMTQPNEKIPIYEGVFALSDGSSQIDISGYIYFNWLPNSGAHFEGFSKENRLLIDSICATTENLDLIIDGLIFGKVFITNVNFRNNDPTKIKGIATRHATLLDKSKNVDTVKFAIPNLREINGDPTTRFFNGITYRRLSRISLENDKYVIIIDKSIHFETLSKKLHDEGGFILLYEGELKKKKGVISHQESRDVFECLNLFLTFINGRRTSGLFLLGTTNDEICWQDFSNEFVDIHNNSISWISKDSIRDLNHCWRKLNNFWLRQNDKDFFTTVINWYIEANKKSGLTLGAIILAQTALELLYNWLVVENKKLIIGNDSKDITASNKIRLLLSTIQVDYSIPKSFVALQHFANSTTNKLDGPEVVTEIRNAIVHSQEEKRKKLNRIDKVAISQALNLCIWYIELSLLNILEYKGSYFNRCAGQKFHFDNEEKVPWK